MSPERDCSLDVGGGLLRVGQGQEEEPRSPWNLLPLEHPLVWVLACLVVGLGVARWPSSFKNVIKLELPQRYREQQVVV